MVEVIECVLLKWCMCGWLLVDVFVGLDVILWVVCCMFVKCGYDVMSVCEVVCELGIDVVLIVYYFGMKEMLWLVVVE